MVWTVVGHSLFVEEKEVDEGSSGVGRSVGKPQHCVAHAKHRAGVERVFSGLGAPGSF